MISPRKRCSRDFKLQTIRRVRETGQGQAQAALISRLRRGNGRLQKERDFLKNNGGEFSRSSQHHEVRCCDEEREGAKIRSSSTA